MGVYAQEQSKMKSLIFVITLAWLTSICIAESTTASSATTRIAATTPSTTRLATTKKSKYPTPNEVMARIRERQAKRDATPKVALFDLSRSISEKPADFNFFSDADTQTLNSILDLSLIHISE